MSNKYSQYIYDPTTQQWVAPVSGANYDDLANQPVKNAVGKTPETFINLAGLELGRYSLVGYYKLDSTHDVENTTDVMDVIVMTDTVTGKRTVTYPTVDAGVHVINIVTYDNGAVVSQTKQRPGASYWKQM